MRLQRRGGRKLIIPPEGVSAGTAEVGARRDPDQGAREVAPLAPEDRERPREIDHRPRGAGEHDHGLRLPAPAAHLPGGGPCRGDPRRAAANGVEARGDAWVSGTRMGDGDLAASTTPGLSARWSPRRTSGFKPLPRPARARGPSRDAAAAGGSRPAGSAASRGPPSTTSRGTQARPAAPPTREPGPSPPAPKDPQVQRAAPGG